MAMIKKSTDKIVPCLWFNTNAEKAVDYYLSVFKKSKKGRISYYTNGDQMPEGTVLTVEFQLEGQDFIALNGGPHFKFNEAVSLTIYCKTQKEVDYYWETLSKGGEKSMCGWLKDKFGLSWQIVPTIVPEMITDKDPAKRSRVFDAIMKMKKIDIEKIKKAYKGK